MTVMQQLGNIITGKWQSTPQVTTRLVRNHRKFRVLYWFQQPADQYKKDTMAEVIINAVDSIHAETLFWDQVRNTTKFPQCAATEVETIREI